MGSGGALGLHPSRCWRERRDRCVRVGRRSTHDPFLHPSSTRIREADRRAGAPHHPGPTPRRPAALPPGCRARSGPPPPALPPGPAPLALTPGRGEGEGEGGGPGRRALGGIGSVRGRGNVHGCGRGNVHGSGRGSVQGNGSGNVDGHESACRNVHGSGSGNVHGGADTAANAPARSSPAVPPPGWRGRGGAASRVEGRGGRAAPAHARSSRGGSEGGLPRPRPQFRRGGGVEKETAGALGGISVRAARRGPRSAAAHIGGGAWRIP